MTASRKARVTRLEVQHTVEHPAESNVIYLDLRGEPEDRRYLDGGGPWIFLPRKAASAEEWVEQIARRWQKAREGDRV